MYKKELSYYFTSPIAYIVIGLYLIANSLFLWVIPGEWNIIDAGYAEFTGLFQLSPWLLMLLFPAITMRLFAEERQNGTWNLLRTKPISLTKIVLSKYSAACTLLLLALLPNIIHYYIVYFIAEPFGNVDGAAFAGSMIGLLLLSIAFIAIGLFASTITKSQIVAYIVGGTICFILFWILLQDHYASISRGIIDLRDIFYYLLVILVFLNATYFVADKMEKF